MFLEVSNDKKLSKGIDSIWMLKKPLFIGALRFNQYLFSQNVIYNKINIANVNVVVIIYVGSFAIFVN